MTQTRRCRTPGSPQAGPAGRGWSFFQLTVHQFGPGGHALLFGRGEVVVLEAIPGVGAVDVQRLAPAENDAVELLPDDDFVAGAA